MKKSTVPTPIVKLSMQMAVIRTRIDHTQFKNAVNLALQLIERSGQLPNPGGGYIIAPSGCGKTSVIQHIASLHPDIRRGHSLFQPVLSITLSVAPTIKSIAQAILDALHYPDVGRTALDKTQIIIEAFKERGVLILCIDEANHIAEGDRVTSGNAIADWLKRLHDESHVPILLLGTPGGMEKLFKNAEQLRTRLKHRVAIDLFKKGSNFAGLLRAFDRSLPLPERSGLDSPELAAKIFDATEGRLRYLKNLLAVAVQKAVDIGSTRLTLLHLSHAFVVVHGPDSDIKNPFL